MLTAILCKLFAWECELLRRIQPMSESSLLLSHQRDNTGCLELVSLKAVPRDIPAGVWRRGWQLVPFRCDNQACFTKHLCQTRCIPLCNAWTPSCHLVARTYHCSRMDPSPRSRLRTPQHLHDFEQGSPFSLSCTNDSCCIDAKRILPVLLLTVPSF